MTVSTEGGPKKAVSCALVCSSRSASNLIDGSQRFKEAVMSNAVGPNTKLGSRAGPS